MLKRRKTFVILGIASLSIFVYIVLSSRSNDDNNNNNNSINKDLVIQKETSKGSCHCQNNTVQKEFSPISCKINDEVLKNVGQTKTKPQQVRCLIENNGDTSDRIFFPFSFVKNYFDVNAEVRKGRKGPFISLSHSYSRVFPRLKDTQYSPSGSFLQFGGFDVENRPRVKCVTASQGVPLTTQWDRKGYYYPTQICQYALSHWSKHVEELNDPQKLSTKTITIYEDGKEYQGDWKGGDINRVQRQNCVQFDQEISLALNNDRKELVLSFDMIFFDNVNITVTVKSNDVGRVKLKYLPEPNVDIDRIGRTVKFGYGRVVTSQKRPKEEDDGNIHEGETKRFTRNLSNDLMKGLPTETFASKITVEDITLEGFGCVTNISLSNKNSLRFFFHAADWLRDHQDSNGGWPIGVILNKDNSKYSEAEEIPPGWYSAMSQGHAMSVLVRAYLDSKDVSYLESAIRALHLFEVPSSEGGILAKFMSSDLSWYEEYPTNPSSFTLNGFMYSLLGLYDVWTVLKQKENYQDSYKTSERLFSDGLLSLQKLLPLFDTGSGTLYDLRHFTMMTSPKVARWDYHSTHINLLYTFSTIVNDEKTKIYFLATAERWTQYMLGIRSKHN